jgi:hypothetical protein
MIGPARNLNRVLTTTPFQDILNMYETASRQLSILTLFNNFPTVPRIPSIPIT